MDKIKILKRILASSRRKSNGCLVCYLGLKNNGYSQISIGPASNAKKYRTHRFIMHLMLDFDLDSPLIILHNDDICNSKACIEFSHLRIGTYSENAQDKIKKYNTSRT